jgi:predicted negative regulator of RcsB-dependent stress response
MARKKRRFETVAEATTQKKDVPRYQDPFQERLGRTIEGAGKKLEGHGRTVLYGLGALVVLGIIGWIIYSYSGRTSAAAQTALGKAIETSQAQVTEAPPPGGSTDKTYKTERERAEAAIPQFQAVVDKFGGAAAEKAKYFIAVNKLIVDRAAGISELEGLSKSGGEVGSLAKFALAQTRADDGRVDEAIALYQELAGSSDPVVAKETINFEIAKLYEKQGKKQEAVGILFDLVKNASEAKDMEGKTVPLSATAQNAKDKLQALDPQKAAEIPEPAPDIDANSLPFGG